jgi:hypothetical protein
MVLSQVTESAAPRISAAILERVGDVMVVSVLRWSELYAGSIHGAPALRPTTSLRDDWPILRVDLRGIYTPGSGCIDTTRECLGQVCPGTADRAPLPLQTHAATFIAH